MFGELISTRDRFVQTAPADAQITLWEFILREVNFYFPSDICQQRLGAANIASIFPHCNFLPQNWSSSHTFATLVSSNCKWDQNKASCRNVHSNLSQLNLLPEFVGGTRRRWWFVGLEFWELQFQHSWEHIMFDALVHRIVVFHIEDKTTKWSNFLGLLKNVRKIQRLFPD